MAHKPPTTDPADQDNDPPTTTGSNIKFEQVRSIGILMTLATLLGLVIYNALAGGTAWVARSADTQLLMWLLSILLGADLLMSNRHTTARFIASIMISYFTNRTRHPPPTEPNDIDHVPVRKWPRGDYRDSAPEPTAEREYGDDDDEDTDTHKYAREGEYRRDRDTERDRRRDHDRGGGGEN